MPFDQQEIEDHLHVLFVIYGKTYQPAEVIFEEGKPADGLYVLLEGKVRLTTTFHYSLNEEHSRYDAKRYDICTLTSGDYFGEISLLSGSNHSATAIADKKSKVLFFDEETFYANAKKYPQLAIDLLRLSSLRLKHSEDKLKEALGEQEYLSFHLKVLESFKRK